MQEDDEETITNELKEAFRLYDKEETYVGIKIVETVTINLLTSAHPS
ncbi:hypothetical protein E2C01_067406 [Portunus trituberculatus]|uniref:Uncharacterized protein n=1 Tax=Portunus trituberculatus TaxID=210409 RepID=A0A5B7HWL9_PORTR|nr:hypothetical protein [Portunus trituberculatus]